MEKIKDSGRRKFMEAGVFTITGCIAAVSGVALTRFGVGPSFAPIKSKWIETDLDPASLTGDGFAQVILEFDMKDGWVIAPTKALAFVRREKDGSLVAISATCTHLGCVVNWDESRKAFVCPCHSGIYDLEGAVVSGPPPGPLWRHRIKEEEGVILLASRPEPMSGGNNETV